MTTPDDLLMSMGETSQGPIPRQKAAKNQWMMRKRKSGTFTPMYELPDRLFNTKQSAQNTCTYEKHDMTWIQ